MMSALIGAEQDERLNGINKLQAKQQWWLDNAHQHAEHPSPTHAYHTNEQRVARVRILTRTHGFGVIVGRLIP